MTPSEHAARAADLLARASGQPSHQSVGASSADFDVIHAHADLAQTRGTGQHYQAAEAALARAETCWARGALASGYYARAAREARAHASLAKTRPAGAP